MSWDLWAIFLDFSSLFLKQEKNKRTMTVQADAIKNICVCAKFINGNFASYWDQKSLVIFLKISQPCFSTSSKTFSVFYDLSSILSVRSSQECAISALLILRKIMKTFWQWRNSCFLNYPSTALLPNCQHKKCNRKTTSSSPPHVW